MAKAKRKVRGGHPLSTWEEADSVLYLIADCRQRLATIKAETESKIEAAKAEAKERAATLVKGEKALSKSLESFTKAHEGDLEGRSKRLTHGRVGFRRVTKIALTRTVAFVISKLRSRRMGDCIRVKESINKETLAVYGDDVLAKIGARRKTDDVFFIETDEAVLKS